MTDQIPTPMTDAAKRLCGSFNRGSHEYVTVEFARDLERKLALARTALQRTKRCIESPNQAITDTIWIGRGETLVDMIDKAIAATAPKPCDEIGGWGAGAKQFIDAYLAARKEKP